MADFDFDSEDEYGYEDEYDSDAAAEAAMQASPLYPNLSAEGGDKCIDNMLYFPNVKAHSLFQAQNVVQGGPQHERYMCALWLNRFRAFSTYILGKSASSVPTGEDVLQFINIFVQSNSHMGTGGVLSYRTITNAIICLDKALTFAYEYYSLTQHWKMKITVILDQRLRDGYITRGLNSSREPAGAVVIRRMISALYKEAICKGTRSWNATLNEITCILLLACIGCRSGDIMGDTKDIREDLPGLRYSDIQISVHNLSELKARFTVRSGKGMKLDASKFYHVERSELPNSKDNMLCPIKIILIIAMRSGNVRFQTMDQLLLHTSARHDKLVQWSFPDRPVLCAMSGRLSQTVDYDSLAPKQRGNRAMVHALEIMGVTDHASSHATRFGVASDLSKIPFKPAGHSNDQIADVLAHSHESRGSGVTEVYTGSYTQADTWTARVALTPADTPFSKLIHATEEYTAESSRPVSKLENLRKRRAPEEVSADCEDRGLDNTLQGNRAYHSRKAMRRTTENQPNTIPTRASLVSSNNRIATKKSTRHGPPPGHSEADTNVMVSEDAQPENRDTTSQKHADVGFSIDDIVASQNDGNGEDGAVLSMLFDGAEATDAFSVTEFDQSLIDALTGDRINFVDCFSQVNTIRTGGKMTAEALKAADSQGNDPNNSVGPMVRLTFRCPNTPNGCYFRGATNPHAIKQHLLNCRFDAPQLEVNGGQDTLDTNPKNKPDPTRYKCSEKGCEKTFARVGDRKVHFHQIHHPISCWVEGCEDETLYVGENCLLVHIKAAHPPKGRLHPTIDDQYVATFECPLAGCSARFRVYSSRTFVPATFKKHLNTHCIKDKNAQKNLVPAFAGNPCLYPGCASKTRFPVTASGREAYKNHLSTEHDITSQREQHEYSLERVRGYALPLRPEEQTAEQEIDME